MLQPTLTQLDSKFLYSLCAKHCHDLCQGTQVIGWTEERIAATENAKQDNSSSPHVNSCKHNPTSWLPYPIYSLHTTSDWNTTSRDYAIFHQVSESINGKLWGQSSSSDHETNILDPIQKFKYKMDLAHKITNSKKRCLLQNIFMNKFWALLSYPY